MKNRYNVTLRVSTVKGKGEERTTSEKDSKTVRDGSYEMCRQYVLDEIASAVQLYRKVSLSVSDGVVIDDTSYNGDTTITRIDMTQVTPYRAVSAYEILTGIRTKS